MSNIIINWYNWYDYDFFEIGMIAFNRFPKYFFGNDTIKNGSGRVQHKKVGDFFRIGL